MIILYHFAYRAADDDVNSEPDGNGNAIGFPLSSYSSIRFTQK